MYTDTIVTLIGKPLPAKKDVFLQLLKKDLAVRNLAGREQRRCLGSFFTQILLRVRDVVFETLAIADHHFRS